MAFPSTSPLEKALDHLLDSHYSEHTPGMIVSVEQGGQTLYERAIGLAEVETYQKISAHTNFRMASVSKQFTAMAVSRLESEGLVSYHTPLSLFFPQLGTNGKAITLFHLLTHTSGLPDYEELINETRTHQVLDQEVLQVLSTADTLLFKPGSKFRYSNTGYVLLGLVIEKVTGYPYSRILQEQVFLKADMGATCVYEANSSGATIPHRAFGYSQTYNHQFSLSDQSLYSATQPDGCIYTSLTDYRRWYRAIGGNADFSLEPLLAKVQVPIGECVQGSYGMGWFSAQRANGSLEVYHTGNSCGFSHLVVMIPEERVLITAFSNIKDNSLLLPKLLQVILENTSITLESNLVFALPHLTR